MDPSLAGFDSLSKKINKVQGDGQDTTKEGVISAILPELELPLSDEEIIKVTKKWKQEWEGSTQRNDWLQQCEENENYWLGKQFGKAGDDEKRPIVDNLIFEALESFLPQATRRNPEPIVEIDSEEDLDIQFSDRIKDRLASLADRIKLRLKIKKVTRNWAIKMLGVGKIGWSSDEDDIAFKVINPKKLILDPEGTVDEDGYHGRFLGEPRKLVASILEKLAPKKASFIKELVKDEMGTEVQFTEWHTPEYMCWTLNDEVLLKTKNPNWNYDSEEEKVDMDDYGVETASVVPIKGINHFSTPKMPYIFLSIFNIENRPADDTSLIGQNLANQDLINKRNKQIDRNADNQNGGMVVSQERSGLTKEQAKEVTEALRRGGTVVIPTGSPKDAVDRFTGNNLPSDVFQQLGDMRNRMRDIFGVRGSTPAGVANEDTVRGKIINRGLDTDRIGGGVTEYLEQFADDFYNHAVQMMYVHYPEIQQLFATYQPPKLTVSVKEGSLLPKDSTTLANQAIELSVAGKMSLIDLYERLEYPNPEELAANVWLEANAPQLLFQNVPLVQQAMQMQAQAAQQQAMMQQQQQEQQAGQEQQSKQFDHDSKMAQLQQKQQGDMMSKVPMQ